MFDCDACGEKTKEIFACESCGAMIGICCWGDICAKCAGDTEPDE